jgi:ribosomal protein S20
VNVTGKEAALDSLNEIISLIKNSKESVSNDDTNEACQYLQQARKSIMEAEYQINKWL